MSCSGDSVSPDNAPSLEHRGTLRGGHLGALAVAVLALCAGEVARAQFATSVQAVEVYATVTRADELAVPALVASDFEILEDGVRQTVSVFAAGEFPLTVALGVDRSLSMRGEPLRLAIRASQAFLRALRPPDRSMVWAIADGAEVIAPLDAPRESQIAAVAALFPWSTTALHDGVAAALDRLDPEPGRQAVVLFTDGADRYSTATAGAVLDRARRSRALVYSVAVGKTQPPLLADLASVSGGRSIQVRRMEGLEGALTAVASELRRQYLIGYVPERRPGDTAERWRSISVRLTGHAAGLQVRARTGYQGR